MKRRSPILFAFGLFFIDFICSNNKRHTAFSSNETIEENNTLLSNSRINNPRSIESNNKKVIYLKDSNFSVHDKLKGIKIIFQIFQNYYKKIDLDDNLTWAFISNETISGSNKNTSIDNNSSLFDNKTNEIKSADFKNQTNKIEEMKNNNFRSIIRETLENNMHNLTEEETKKILENINNVYNISEEDYDNFNFNDVQNIFANDDNYKDDVEEDEHLSDEDLRNKMEWEKKISEFEAAEIITFEINESKDEVIFYSLKIEYFFQFHF